MPHSRPSAASRESRQDRRVESDSLPPATASNVAHFIPILLAVATFVAYLPVLPAEFTTWDDVKTISTNPRLNPPTLDGVLYFWNPAHPQMDLWVPLTYTAWAAVAKVAYVQTPDDLGSHLNSWFFHAANVCVHVMSVLLVYAILRRFVRRPWAAAAGALLFALHPMQVETVAWVSGMKDLLAGCLALASIWQYVCFAAQRPTDESSLDAPHSDVGARTSSTIHYVIATVAFVLAMLAKPSAVITPVLVAVVDLWLLRRPPRGVMASLAPWLLLAVPIVIEGRFAQPARSVAVYPIVSRVLVAGYSLSWYLGKLALPVRLSVLYGRTLLIVLGSPWVWAGWLAPAALAAAAIVWRPRLPWLLPALALFALGFAPVLGFVRFDYQQFSTVADHYAYLPMLGPALAVAFVLQRIRRVQIASAVVGVAVAVLGIATFRQGLVWQSSITLYEHAWSLNHANGAAASNLALAYSAAGRSVEGERVLRETLAATANTRDPSYARMHTNMVLLLADQGKIEEAQREFEISRRLDPNPAAIKANEETLANVRAELARRAAEKAKASSNEHPPAQSLTPETQPIQ